MSDNRTTAGWRHIALSIAALFLWAGVLFMRSRMDNWIASDRMLDVYIVLVVAACCSSVAGLLWWENQRGR